MGAPGRTHIPETGMQTRRRGARRRRDCRTRRAKQRITQAMLRHRAEGRLHSSAAGGFDADCTGSIPPSKAARSEEHTSELQSLMLISYAVFCLANKTYMLTPHTTTSCPT